MRSTAERDPKRDPEPGDRVAAGGYEFRVDFVSIGWVYAVRWAPGQEDGSPIAVSLEAWREDMSRG